ncbi:MAG TPA: FAD-dependent oxidoreductase [Bryobacteraceae bacterium]
MSTVIQSSNFTARLIKHHQVADNAMAFQFEKPAGWSFKAGQFLELTLLNPAETDAEGNTRTFSIASAPHEPHLTVAAPMSDTAFNRMLRSMPLDSEVKLAGPFGDFTLHNNASRTAVFLADGIGIAPFHSILLDAAQRMLPHRIFLFYSNRRPEDAPFLEELQALQQQNPHYKLIATMTEMGQSHRAWKGNIGPIDYQLLNRELKAAATPDWYVAGPIYYLAGSPQAVHDFQAMLIDNGIDSDDIRTEEFAATASRIPTAAPGRTPRRRGSILALGIERRVNAFRSVLHRAHTRQA